MSTAPELFIPAFGWGDRVRKARREVGVTQVDMADALGIKPETLAAWESGRNTPARAGHYAELIEQRYGVPAWWMLGRSPAPGSGRRVSDTELMHTREAIAA